MLNIIKSNLIVSNPDSRLPAMAVACLLNGPMLSKLKNTVVSSSGRYVKPQIDSRESALGAQSTSDFREHYAQSVQASFTQTLSGMAAATILGMAVLGVQHTDERVGVIEHSGLRTLQINEGQCPIPKSEINYVGHAIVRRED